MSLDATIMPEPGGKDGHGQPAPVGNQCSQKVEAAVDSCNRSRRRRRSPRKPNTRPSSLRCTVPKAINTGRVGIEPASLGAAARLVAGVAAKSAAGRRRRETGRRLSVRLNSSENRSLPAQDALRTAYVRSQDAWDRKVCAK